MNIMTTKEDISNIVYLPGVRAKELLREIGEEDLEEIEARENRELVSLKKAVCKAFWRIKINTRISMQQIEKNEAKGDEKEMYLWHCRWMTLREALRIIRAEMFVEGVDGMLPKYRNTEGFSRPPPDKGEGEV